MSNREVKVYYFKCDVDIQSYILNLKDISNIESSIVYRGNHIQLRDISKSGNYILGRLCKVREIEKPMVGSAFEKKEEPLSQDIIESSHFIYNPKNLEVIIQNNVYVSADPNGLLSNLLTKTHKENLSNGLGISAIVRKDALEKIIEGRGYIKQLKVILDKSGSNYLAKENSNDVEMSNSFFGDMGLDYSEKVLSYKVKIGSVKKSLITQISDLFNAKKIKDASFTIDGNRSPIKLSEFVKFEFLQVEVDDGSFDTEDFKEKLLNLMSDEQ